MYYAATPPGATRNARRQPAPYAPPTYANLALGAPVPHNARRQPAPYARRANLALGAPIPVYAATPPGARRNARSRARQTSAHRTRPPETELPSPAQTQTLQQRLALASQRSDPLRIAALTDKMEQLFKKKNLDHTLQARFIKAINHSNTCYHCYEDYVRPGETDRRRVYYQHLMTHRNKRQDIHAICADCASVWDKDKCPFCQVNVKRLPPTAFLSLNNPSRAKRYG
jgi:hypothetical protein